MNNEKHNNKNKKKEKIKKVNWVSLTLNCKCNSRIIYTYSKTFFATPPPFPLNVNPPDCIFCLKIYPDPLINTPLVYEIFLKCRPLPAIRLPLQLAAKEYNAF